jgi:hypothetical protein
MAYKGRGAKVRVEIVRDGTEVLISANPEGMRYVSDICAALADDQHDPHRPPHVHVEPALNSAEPGSVPMEILLTSSNGRIGSGKPRVLSRLARVPDHL